MAASREWAQTNLWQLFDLSLLRTSGLEAYLESTLSHCADCFQATAGSIFLREGDAFVIRATVGTSAPPPGARFVHGRGIAGIVAASGKGRLIINPTDQEDLAEFETDSSIGSSLVLPLTNPAGIAIGVLNLSRPAAAYHFSPHDLNQAQLVAGQIAMAVENARLVSSLSDSLADAQGARDTMQGIITSLPGSILVYDESGNLLEENSRISEVGSNGRDGAAELRDEATECRKEALESMSNSDRHLHILNSDEFWHIQAIPLRRGGCVVTLLETTARERSAREASRLTRLAEIGQMTAQIAHEIRNPLTGIKSAAQMIRQHPEVMPDFIGTIEEEAVRLNELCDEFLEFSRPAAVSTEITSLSKVVEGVLKMQKMLYKERGIQLITKVKRGEPIPLDSKRIGQVLHNLLRNAMEATKSGGAVTFTSDSDSFSIQDDGHGMDEATLAKLFSPFFTTKSYGNGLGLCTVRKIIEAHGGEITVNSALNSGTTFMVRLPSYRQLAHDNE